MYFVCTVHRHTLSKVVSHYALSVLSMSAIGLKKNHLDGWVVGGVSSIQFFLELLATYEHSC